MINTLNSKFAAKGNIFFKKGGDNLIIAKIENKYSSCEISLYGAQVLSFEPNGEEDVLWMSKKSFFEKGKAIRGGIPVCFPWFGPHKSDSEKPQHGFARLIDWEVDHVINRSDSSTQLILKCSNNEYTSKLWPFEFEAKLIITVSDQLEVALEIRNKGQESFEYTDALHTYFRVSDIEDISISGFKDAQYHNGLLDDSIKIQNEKLLHFHKEENRRYIAHSNECTIFDKNLERNIHISKNGSYTTVVWNPWEETTKKISDMKADGYKTMVCIEAANAYDDFIRLLPGESYTMSTVIKPEKTNKIVTNSPINY